jgi:outer membrane protein assembly factor BamB
MESWITCLTTVGDKELWRFMRKVTGPVFDGTLPVWLGGNVYWLSGERWRKSQLVCLDGEAGKEIWRWTLPDSIFWSTDHQLAGGGYATSFSSLQIDDELIMVIDGSGRLHWLAPATGKVLGSFHPSRQYLCPPAVRGDNLVVCKFDSITSYPMTTVLARGSRDAVLAEGRDALASG